MVGSLGNAAAFSFYPTKNLGAYGEGGALTTNDDLIAQFARAARSHGQTARYAHEFVGYNYRMQGFQGAVLRIKLRHLNAWTEKRRAIARGYRRILQNARIDLPVDDPRDECVYHQFVIYVNSRCSVIAKLAEKEIETAVHYPTPVHLQPAYASLGDPAGTYPLAERACDRVLSLPLFPGLSEEQVRHAADSVLEIVGGN
jgi:dTDP-4-amino-4,6-dideoxygalactose transaminase